MNSTIVDKIALTIRDAQIGKDDQTPLPFIYADLDTQNILLDNVGVPFAACAPLSSGMVSDTHNRFHERATFEVFFGDLMEQDLADYDAVANEHIIDTCKRRAFKWLASIRPASGVQLISINSAQRAYLQFDSIVTGYLVNVTLEEMDGLGLCDYTPEHVPTEDEQQAAK